MDCHCSLDSQLAGLIWRFWTCHNHLSLFLKIIFSLCTCYWFCFSVEPWQIQHLKHIFILLKHFIDSIFTKGFQHTITQNKLWIKPMGLDLGMFVFVAWSSSPGVWILVLVAKWPGSSYLGFWFSDFYLPCMMAVVRIGDLPWKYIKCLKQCLANSKYSVYLGCHVYEHSLCLPNCFSSLSFPYQFTMKKKGIMFVCGFCSLKVDI